MIELRAFAKLDRLPDFGLSKVEDLVFYDGPLLSELRSKNGEPFLAYWVDCDDSVNRWMYIRADEPSLVRMKMRKLAMERVIPHGSRDGYVYFIDLNPEGKTERCQLVYVADVPVQYQPKKAALLPQSIRKKNPNLLTVAIDGDWEYEAWSSFPRQLAFAYSLLLLERVQGIDNYPPYAWRHRGGFSSSKFGPWIVSRVNRSDRLEMRTVQYSSPGFIRYSLNGEITGILLQTLNHYAENSASIEAVEDVIESYIKMHALDNLVDDARLKGLQFIDWGTHVEPLRALTDALWSALALVDVGKSLKDKVEEPWVYMHITRWFLRRIRQLNKFRKKNLVDFPG